MAAISKMRRTAGSYDLSKFSMEEIDRLVKQGRLTWESECELLRWGGLKVGDVVLDLGCGPGVISGLLADEVGPGGSVTGIDLNPDLLDIGRQMNGKRVTNYQGSVYDLRDFKGQFDFIYVRLVMQHVAHPQAALAEILKALRPGGRVCILDSNEDVLAIHPQPPGFDQLLAETQMFQRLRGGDRFVGGKLSTYLHQSGFTDIHSRVLLITPDMIGIDAFLDTVLTWRPQLYPEELRQDAAQRVDQMREHVKASIIDGYNGAFIVFGAKPVI